MKTIDTLLEECNRLYFFLVTNRSGASYPVSVTLSKVEANVDLCKDAFMVWSNHSQVARQDFKEPEKSWRVGVGVTVEDAVKNWHEKLLKAAKEQAAEGEAMCRWILQLAG